MRGNCRERERTSDPARSWVRHQAKATARYRPLYFDDEHAATVEPGRAGERHERQNCTFAMVVHPRRVGAVLDGDRDYKCPQDQREDTNGGLEGKASTEGLDDRLQGVERTRREVAT